MHKEYNYEFAANTYSSEKGETSIRSIFNGALVRADTSRAVVICGPGL